MTLDHLRFRLQSLGYTPADLTTLTGIERSTICHLYENFLEDISLDDFLSLLYVANEAPPVPRPAGSFPSVLREVQPLYQTDHWDGFDFHEKRQGEYTIDDFWAIPEQCYVELINGVLIRRNAPTTFHQEILGEMYRQIANYLVDYKYPCKVYFAPLCVQFSEENVTDLPQPDLVIICDSDKILPTHILGTPDFLLEVISPSTRREDYITKLSLYRKNGVREYWLVDPYQRTVIVHVLGSETSPTIYPIDAVIPVTLYHGDLTINISRSLDTLP